MTGSPEPTAGRTTASRHSTLWRVVQGVVLAAFAVTVLVIAVLVVRVIQSATASTFDPHGYTMIFGTIVALALTPVALGLWLLQRYLGRRARQ